MQFITLITLGALLFTATSLSAQAVPEVNTTAPNVPLPKSPDLNITLPSPKHPKTMHSFKQSEMEEFTSKSQSKTTSHLRYSQDWTFPGVGPIPSFNVSIPKLKWPFWWSINMIHTHRKVIYLRRQFSPLIPDKKYVSLPSCLVLSLYHSRSSKLVKSECAVACTFV